MKNLSHKEVLDMAKEIEEHGKMIDEAKHMLSDPKVRATPEGRAQIFKMITTVKKHHDKISAVLRKMETSKVGGPNIKRKIGD